MSPNANCIIGKKTLGCKPYHAASWRKSAAELKLEKVRGCFSRIFLNKKRHEHKLAWVKPSHDYFRSHESIT
ncbi:hypothetical protein DTO96_101824 [Ephemeroptericola cinctiostellae]|uniref:Uncharacterized protein n=1 Tax=Ephemeroptericola cinctiostellae TaxID=2268024 RepID=A0A345DCJ5_9BURK|nr:hypothetical protein DTO96_101824 [Ephemeroptericola cinctiostellae]